MFRKTICTGIVFLLFLLLHHITSFQVRLYISYALNNNHLIFTDIVKSLIFVGN